MSVKNNYYYISNVIPADVLCVYGEKKRERYILFTNKTALLYILFKFIVIKMLYYIVVGRYVVQNKDEKRTFSNMNLYK